MSSEHQDKQIWIAVDAMGGDFGPKTVIPALDIVLEGRDDVRFLIFGDEAKITPYIDKAKLLKTRCNIIHTELTIKNDDKPSAILRSSKGTSMRMAIESVKENKALAVVSAGNTGALMALAKIVLKTVPGLHRPAIASVMPGDNGGTIMLDLGANVLVDSQNLVQFAVLGSIFATAEKKLTNKPTVGLLNVGTESTKGPDHVRGAADMLSRLDFPGEYVGYVEGDDITKGSVDVIVADGYAGNIALKTAEGVGRMVKGYFQESFTSNPLAMIAGVLAYFPLKVLKKKMDPRLYNGGVFLGLNGLCIKSHGGADEIAFSSAVIKAVRLARGDYIDQVIKDINHLSDQEDIVSDVPLSL